MAKGLRSSVKKANRTKLRSRVFGPVEDARTQRLSAKLLELASQPKPSKPLDSRMDVEETEDEMLDEALTKQRIAQIEEDLEMADEATIQASKSSKKKSPSKIVKHGRGKPRNTMVFPSYKKGKRVLFTRSKK